MTPEQRRAALEVVQVITEAIRELKEVPSGELYARLMPHGISIGNYQTFLDMLQGAKLIQVKNHLITWVGPTIPK